MGQQTRVRPVGFSFVVAMVVVGASGSAAHAQAWIEEQHALDLSLDYNLGISDKVIEDNRANSDLPNAGTQSHQVTLSAMYVPLTHLAVDVELPFEVLKFTGAVGPDGRPSQPGYYHPGGGAYDDGKFHSTLTDLRAGVRYQVLEAPFAFTPLLALSVPVASYETIGNAVAGRHLTALHVGASIGKIIADAFYVHLTYEFTLAQKYNQNADTAKFSQNRSDAALTVGVKLLEDRLDLNVDANARINHDGIEFKDFGSGSVLPDEIQYHDAILKEQVILVGAGVGYQITNSFGMSLAGRLFVYGQNTQNASVLALGLTWKAH